MSKLRRLYGLAWPCALIFVGTYAALWVAQIVATAISPCGAC